MPLLTAYQALLLSSRLPSTQLRLRCALCRYKPHSIELETRLRPFLPDYIPATGGIDEFIKVPRPDGKPDFLGLKVRPL